MKQYYKMKVAGCDRELPLCPVNEHLDIAAFIMFGDIEVTEKAAKLLLEKCPEHDVLVTAEAKGIPLCYEMARQGCLGGNGKIYYHRKRAEALSF